jgi:hypothetical protein
MEVVSEFYRRGLSGDARSVLDVGTVSVPTPSQTTIFATATAPVMAGHGDADYTAGRE